MPKTRCITETVFFVKSLNVWNNTEYYQIYCLSMYRYISLISIIKMHPKYSYTLGEWETWKNLQITQYNSVMEPNKAYIFRYRDDVVEEISSLLK